MLCPTRIFIALLLASGLSAQDLSDDCIQACARAGKTVLLCVISAGLAGHDADAKYCDKCVAESCGADSDATKPEPAKLTSPAPGTPLNADVTFGWSKGKRVRQYRLVVTAKPEVGPSVDFDTGVTTSQSASPTGFPADTTVFVTLWSIGEDGEYLQPAQEYRFRTARPQTLLGMKMMPSIELQGLSFRVFALPADNAEGCRQECARNQACQAFTYYRPGFRGNSALCDLKSTAAASAQANNCCISGIKSLPPPIASSGVPGGQVMPKPGILSGRWISGDGGPLEIVQQGSSVSGTYRAGPAQPELIGSISGIFDGRTFRGSFQWRNGNQTGAGTLTFSVTPDGRLEGRWGYADGTSGVWNVRKAALEDYFK